MTEQIAPAISRWVSQARHGNEVAFSRLFDFYFSRLRTYISPRLTSRDRHEGYEEDMAVDCMQRLWEDLTEGRFEAIVHREDLWNAMMCIAQSKTIDRRRFHRSKKRLCVILNQMEFVSECSSSHKFPPSELEFVEEWRLFEASLPDDQYREIVRFKMEGMDVADIQNLLEMLPRRLQRKLVMIEELWKAFATR